MERLLAEAKQRSEPQWYIDRLPGEAPQHRVRISRPFCLGTCEVTVGQFRQFVADVSYLTEAEKDGKGGYGNDATGQWMQKPEWKWLEPGFTQSDVHPVVHVSWNDAVAFCEWLSRKEGTTYRLPTEAEREYACRAGTTTLWHCGDSDATLQERVWFAANSQGKTHPVGQLKPNAWGLFDLHGNVWEWCGDWFDNGYYQNLPSADPMGPMAGSGRVYRAGGWSSPASSCRSALRFANRPHYRDSRLGFRVATVPSFSPANPAPSRADGWPEPRATRGSTGTSGC